VGEDQASRIESGDPRLLVDRLYAEYGPPLLRYLRRLAGPDEDPQDALHETFLRLWRQPNPDTIDNIRAWLFRVATNVAHNRRRDVRRSREREQVAFGEAAVAGDAHEQLEIRQRVSRALASVDDRARRVLLLYAEGFTYREIAGILDLQPGHVGVLMQRARDQFRRSTEVER
jgi:RNA polymerase sigma-70 factor, ECF subfamily